MSLLMVGIHWSLKESILEPHYQQPKINPFLRSSCPHKMLLQPHEQSAFDLQSRKLFCLQYLERKTLLIRECGYVNIRQATLANRALIHCTWVF